MKSSKLKNNTKIVRPKINSINIAKEKFKKTFKKYKDSLESKEPKLMLNDTNLNKKLKRGYINSSLLIKLDDKAEEPKTKNSSILFKPYKTPNRYIVPIDNEKLKKNDVLISLNDFQKTKNYISNLNKKEKMISNAKNHSFRSALACANNFQTMMAVYNYKPSANINRRKRKRLKLARKILNLLQTLRYLDLTLKEFIENNLWPKKPSTDSLAKNFFLNVKLGNPEKVNYYVRQNKYLVYCIDSNGMTGMHWAAKRNQYEILKFLLSMNGNPNQCDFQGRTCLYFAVLSGNKNSVLELLYRRAKPSAGKFMLTEASKHDSEIYAIIQKSVLVSLF